MDHEVVVREKMTEKYLLDELDPGIRGEFEEHFFDCQRCALDVRAASDFIAQSKVVLSEGSKAEADLLANDPRQRLEGWRAWLRPAFVVPVFALLLAVIGYQNLVTYPRLERAITSPQVLPWAALNVGTWGSETPVIITSSGQGFLLFVRIPPDPNYARYKADLHGPSGTAEWSVEIPAAANQDVWPIAVPPGPREPGQYSLVVHGVTASDEVKDIGRTSFELQIQK
jgi:hypothetical protein